MTGVVLAVALFLAWSNGSNDNFKGVATIYGSGTASYRTALAWATATTLAGSLLTLLLAASLIKTFSAKGLVPDAVATFCRRVRDAKLAVALAGSIQLGNVDVALRCRPDVVAVRGGVCNGGRTGRVRLDRVQALRFALESQRPVTA